MPTLKRGDIVISDNLSAHKRIAVLKTIGAARARLLYLPKYSSDLIPIEQAFSKLNAFLRRAAEPTIPRHCGRIHTLLDAVRAKECAKILYARRHASI